MPTHPGHPAIASTTLVSASRSLLNDAFDSVSLQTVTATATLNPDDGRYVLVAPASHATITLPDPSSDERYQNVRLVLKRTTASVYTATVVVAGGGLIDGSSSTTLNAQYDCEVLFSDGTAWHRLRDQTNLLAPDYLDFGDWIVGTDDSNPAPVATSDAYTAPDGTTTADELEWDNTTELADESWAEPGASVLEAGDGAEYSFYIDSEVGDGIKTVLEVEDTSVPGLLEQTTVAFSNVFAEERYTSYAPGSDPAGHYLNVGNWARVGDWTVASSAYSPPVDISSPFDFESITASGGGKRIVGDIGTESYIPGQEVTVSLWIYKPSFSTNAGNITWWFSLRDASNTDVERILVYINTSGEIASISGVTSGGPGYTASNATRLQAHASDSDWAKLSIRLRDYSGTAIRTQIMFGYSAILGQKFTIAQPSFYLGDHVSSQQLLTVEDGVENLLVEAGYDITDATVNNGTLAVDAIAAPDGTLTAYSYTANSTSGVLHRAQLPSITPANLGSKWHDGSAWNYRIWVYAPSIGSYAPLRLYWRVLGATNHTMIAHFNASMGIQAFSGSTTGGPALSAERNVSVKAIGDSGWHQVDLTLFDYEVNATSVYWNLPYYASYTVPDWEYVFWSPELRYGDWVARGKNWQGTPLIDWAVTAGASKAYSPTPAPDGTLSAVEASLPAGGNCDLSATNALAAAVPAYSSVTLEAYINHSDGDWDSGRIYHYLRSSSSFPEMVYIDIDRAGGFASSLVTLATAGPGYTTAEHTEATQIGTDGWWRYRLTITDYGGTALTTWNYLRAANSAGATRGVFWGPRITVGNPADARGYFVSGPQNLLGDGSDYSGWSVAGSPTLTTNALVAPNGRLEADTINWLNGDTLSKSVTGLSFGAGATSVFYYKYDAALSGALCIKYDSRLRVGTTTTERAVVYINNTNDPATALQSFAGGTTGGPGYTSDDVTITALTNDWMRVEVRLFDYAGTADGAYVRMDAQQATAYDLTLWGSEVTTLDRTPTANELRPVSNGVVDFDAYPPEHRSLFADLEDAGDNWYKVTTKITDI